MIRPVLDFQTGDLARGRCHSENLAQLTMSGRTWGASVPSLAQAAHIGGDDDWLDHARDLADAVISGPHRLRDKVQARLGLAMIGLRRGDDELIVQQYEALTSSTVTSSIYICVDRLLGLLAQTMGKPNDAAAHFEDALAFCRKAGYRPELAWTLYDHVDLLIERNDPTDPYVAKALLDESLVISTELGIRPLVERVLSRREILKA